MEEKPQEVPYLKSALYSYLMLGVTDTLHHFHAATALGQDAAMHAVWTGVVLIPIAVVSIIGYMAYRHKILLWLFIGIALLAVLLPGIYHGGWDHLVKVLGHLRLEGETADIRNLFPADNMDLWLYEISGSLEFLLSLIALYFLVRLLGSAK